MSRARILVVDDELAIRQVLAANLRKAGYEVEELDDGVAALERLQAGDIDIAICDIRMPEMSGIDLLREAQQANIDTTFLLITAHASLDTAIEAMRLGAFDYLTKPVRTEEVLHQVKQIVDLRGLRNENRLLRTLVLKDKDATCLFESPAIQQIEKLIGKVAPTDSTVLITGESGTGKGVTARRIHSLSHRAGAPFIPVNCGSIPENLIESELFGHVKGAFTGADRAKKGLFFEADKGTLFLDEIGELPLHLQVKLLHVIESQQIRPVGGDQFRKVDVRIVAATNRDLDKMVAEGRFREDLFFRLNVFHIHIPPLRERREDIRKLIHFLLERDRDRFANGRRLRLTPEAESLLLAYDWPGNVREVENVIDRALILAEDEDITIADLPETITALADEHLPEAGNGGRLTLREQVRMYERSLILRALEEAGGDRSRAARNLGIGQSTLYRKLDEYGDGS